MRSESGLPGAFEPADIHLNVDESGRVVTDYDHHDNRHSVGASGPYDAYAKLRAQCPVAWSTKWDGFWVVADYANLQTVALDDDTYSSARGMGIPAIGNARPLLPIMTDPPEFWSYRRPLNPWFTPLAIQERWEPQIRDLANELIDAFIERGEADLVGDYSQPLPARLTLRLLGIEESRWEEILHNVQVGVHESARDLDRSIEACMEMYAAIANVIDERRAGGYQDDLISYLLTAETETPSGQFEEEEILDICALILFGGLDTTTSATAHALFHLAGHPELRAALVADATRIPLAVEEFIRYEAPVQGLPRTATRDVELGGQKIKEGDRLWLLWASANRDGARFDRPDELVLDRHPNHHVSFGIGIHRCLGAHLGRAQMRIMLEEFLRRIPHYELAADPGLVRHSDVSVGYGYRNLRIRFDL